MQKMAAKVIFGVTGPKVVKIRVENWVLDCHQLYKDSLGMKKTTECVQLLYNFNTNIDFE